MKVPMMRVETIVMTGEDLTRSATYTLQLRTHSWYRQFRLPAKCRDKKSVV